MVTVFSNNLHLRSLRRCFKRNFVDESRLTYTYILEIWLLQLVSCIFPYPIHVLGNSCVYAWVGRFTAFVAETHNAQLYPV